MVSLVSQVVAGKRGAGVILSEIDSAVSVQHQVFILESLAAGIKPAGRVSSS